MMKRILFLMLMVATWVSASAQTKKVSVLGDSCSQGDCPHVSKEILNLASWAVKDARKVSNPAKDYYKRLKPFQVFHEASLKDDAEKAVSSSTYAYPSGHAVRSWTYAFVLADVAPEYTDVLNKCANDYSMGRVIMGRHWKTDIDAGKMVAAKVYEQLKKSPAYQAQLKLAREQYKTVQKK